jgi:hypothetical protein
MFIPKRKRKLHDARLVQTSRLCIKQETCRCTLADFAHLEHAGIWRDGSWHFEHTAPDFGMALIKPLNHHPTIVELASGEAFAAASELADDPLDLPGHPALLFTLPNATTWTLPHQN